MPVYLVKKPIFPGPNGPPAPVWGPFYFEKNFILSAHNHNCIVKHNEAEKKEEDVEDSDGY